MTAPQRVVVLGAEGLLGREVVARLCAADRWDVTGVDLLQLDITDAEGTRRFVQACRPQWLVNCAAMTHVDGCQERPAEAQAVNADAVVSLAEVCDDVGATLVQLGTDYVFDGRLTRPYREDDAANPLGAYARTKWGGEQHAQRCRDHLIVRTAWLYGVTGNSFVATMLSRARAGAPLRVVSDEIGSPSYALDVAEGMERLMRIDARGVFHLVNGGQASWFELARCAIDLAGIDASLAPTTAAEYASPTPRPPYSVLDCTKYTNATQHHLRTWRAALSDFIETVARSD